jgi:hypothetical protein
MRGLRQNRGPLLGSPGNRCTGKGVARYAHRSIRRMTLGTARRANQSGRSSHFFWFSENMFVPARRKSPAYLSHPPHRGAYRDRHGRGVGCGGREGVRRAVQSQGEMNLVSDVWHADEQRLSVRQNRVVLTPVAGVKSAKVFSKPNRVRETVNSPMTVTRKNSSPGRARHKP